MDVFEGFVVLKLDVAEDVRFFFLVPSGGVILKLTQLAQLLALCCSTLCKSLQFVE